MLETLRTGDWLTLQRLNVYPRILLALMVLAIIVWVGMSNGLVDRNGKPIGTDFSNVYAAGELTLKGTPEAAYDPQLQHEAEQDIFDGRSVPFYGWHYPPTFLFAAALLAVLPYGWALLVWMALTLPAFVATVRSIAPRPETLVLALAFPPVFVNLAHGQNGYLTATLLGGALLLLDRKPVISGMLIGMLAYKPQFGVLIPLILMATGRWQAFTSAAVTVAASCAATAIVFGTDVWLAFMESTDFTRNVVLEQGSTGWEKIQSIFSAVRMWGAGIGTAYAVQTGLALCIAASLVRLWRSEATHELKAAGLAAACLLATPYVLDYDLVVLGLPIAFMAAHGLKSGFRDYEVTLLAVVWLSPLVTRSIAGATSIPLGLVAMLSIYALIIHRAASDVSATRNRRANLVEA